jgi:uncharacterized protein YndB with AHSA1/START domain
MHEIVHELTIAAPAKNIFDAITTPEGLAGWWSTDAEATPELDSITKLRLATGAQVVLRVDLLEAPELVHWECVEGPEEWVGTTIALRIEALDRDDDGQPDGVCRLRFWHGGWPYADGMMPRSSFEWAMRLDSLRRYLETGTGSPR